jgi:cobalt-zinc-cadmium efflux system outer membrane protein
MMPKMTILIVFISALLPQRALADTDSLLSLKELIEEVKRENPGLRAVIAEHAAAEYGISWLHQLPDPLISVEFSGEMTMYGVTQQIPFPTKITKRSDLARLNADQKYLLYQDKEKMLIKDAKEAYAAFLLLRGKITTAEKSIGFLEQIHNIARQKFSINEASQTEVLIAGVALATAENELLSLHDDLGIVAAYLNTLLNRDPDEELQLVSKEAPSVDTLPLTKLYELAKENRPQLKSFDLRRSEARAALSLARQSYLPDLVFRYTHERMNDNMSNSKYMVGVSLPLWFWGKQDNMVRESKSYLRSAAARYEMMENATLLDVKEAKARIDKYRRTTELYRNAVLPQAETALKSALAAYELNRIDFNILLESERSLIQAEYDFEEAQANLFMAVARLEQVIGDME